jgi:hypothetical protein
VYINPLFSLMLPRENCIFETLNNVLRRFGTSNIDFVKITLQMFDS